MLLHRQQEPSCLRLYLQHGPDYTNQFMKLRVLEMATVSEFVQFGFQTVGHFLLFLPRKERVIGGAKLHNVRAVGFDLLPLPGPAEVACEKNTEPLSALDHFHSSRSRKTTAGTWRIWAPLWVFRSVGLDTLATGEEGGVVWGLSSRLWITSWPTSLKCLPYI